MVTMVRCIWVRTKIVTQGLIPFQTYYRHTQTSVLPTPQKAQPSPACLSIQAPVKHQSATQLSCTAARVQGMQNSQLLIWWSFWEGYVCSLRTRHCQRWSPVQPDQYSWRFASVKQKPVEKSVGFLLHLCTEPDSKLGEIMLASFIIGSITSLTWWNLENPLGAVLLLKATQLNTQLPHLSPNKRTLRHLYPPGSCLYLPWPLKSRFGLWSYKRRWVTQKR